MTSKLRLGINIDHVATLRNARSGDVPCPVRAARMAADAGADGITAHLREDRRHVRDADIRRIRAEVGLPLNFEMAATAEMLAIALEVKPNACCLVPEKREERTTEGGLDVLGQEAYLKGYCAKLKAAGIRVSLFVAADAAQMEAAARVGADIVELHTGGYAEIWPQHASLAPYVFPHRGKRLMGAEASSINPIISKVAANAGPHPSLPPTGEGTPSLHVQEQISKLQNAAKLAHSLGLEVHAGHGLTFENVRPIAAISEVVELNIGHFIIGESVFLGLENVIRKMRALMDAAR